MLKSLKLQPKDGIGYDPIVITLKQIQGLTGLDMPDFVHSFEVAPTVDGARHIATRLDQRRVTITYALPADFSERVTTLQTLTLFPARESCTLEIEMQNNKKYYLHDVYIERVVTPTISSSPQPVIIDLISAESYIYGAQIVNPLNVMSVSVIENPLAWFDLVLTDQIGAVKGTTRGFGVRMELAVTAGPATQIIVAQTTHEEKIEKMMFNVPERAGNRLLEVDTRFGRKSVLLNGENAMNSLTYDSVWIKSESLEPNVYAFRATNINYYLNEANSKIFFEPAYLGVPGWLS